MASAPRYAAIDGSSSAASAGAYKRLAPARRLRAFARALAAMRAALALALLLMLTACRMGAPPEQRLRAAMDELQNAIEQHDAARIEERLSKDFVGPDGLDRAGARRIAAASFLRYRDVWMRIASVELKVQGDRATVNFIAAISGGSGQPLPEVAQMYRVQTGWREEDGEWRITSAQWVGRW